MASSPSRYIFDVLSSVEARSPGLHRKHDHSSRNATIGSTSGIQRSLRDGEGIDNVCVGRGGDTDEEGTDHAGKDDEGDSHMGESSLRKRLLTNPESISDS